MQLVKKRKKKKKKKKKKKTVFEIMYGKGFSMSY